MTVDASIAALTPTEARALTDQIKVAVEGTWHLIERAYTSRAWTALGYASWDDYCTREFGTSRLRLPREERQEVVASLRESGLSVRAISAATGVGVGTVARELSAPPRVPNGTPAQTAVQEQHPIGDPVASQSTSTVNDGRRYEAPEIEQPRHPASRVTGIDGKTYAPTRAEPAKPRADIPRTINSALIQIDNARRALQALTPAQVAHQSEEARRAWSANLSESIEALSGFLEAL